MVIKTLSIPQWMEDFLKENSDLSPSKILQSKIIEIQESKKLNFREVKFLRKKLDFAVKELQKVCDHNQKLQDELDICKKKISE